MTTTLNPEATPVLLAFLGDGIATLETICGWLGFATPSPEEVAAVQVFLDELVDRKVILRGNIPEEAAAAKLLLDFKEGDIVYAKPLPLNGLLTQDVGKLLIGLQEAYKLVRVSARLISKETDDQCPFSHIEVATLSFLVNEARLKLRKVLNNIESIQNNGTIVETTPPIG